MRRALAGHDSENGQRARSGLLWPHVVEDQHAWNVIASKQPYSKAAESYRTLRSSLLLGGEGDAKVLVITSAMPSEGKTLTAVNCAAVLAQQGSKVLLVDADLRRSSLHRNLGIQEGARAGRCAERTMYSRGSGGDGGEHSPFVGGEFGRAVTYPAEALASAGDGRGNSAMA